MQRLFAFHDTKGPERCGVILRDGEIVELPNIHPDPAGHFSMEIDQPGVIATWHTHPRTGPNLSIGDYQAFKAYPHLLHYIVTASEIWCFGMLDGLLSCYDENHITRLPEGPSPS